jgi:DNA-binding winged helix-turn-helix (wHTH) protein
LIERIVEALGCAPALGVVPVERGSRASDGSRASAGDTALEIVFDSRASELRTATRVLSFKRRPIVRRLLRALAAHPGAVVSKEELAAVLWSRPYNPISDDNPIRVNVRALRKLLEDTGLSIEFQDTGYLLVTGRRASSTSIPSTENDRRGAPAATAAPQ